MAKKQTTSKAKPAPSRKPARAARIGDNTLEGRTKPYLKRIEKLLDDLDSERGSYMAKCRPIHEDIREIYGEAKDNGVPIKALKGLVKWRELAKKQAGIGADFEDMDEKASYDQLVEGLGPLGLAAAVAAGYRSNEDDRDVRPRHLQEAERQRQAENGSGERPDADALAQVGRGPAAPADAPTDPVDPPAAA
jgi:uncharacterized protein (UPF0335 family)